MKFYIAHHYLEETHDLSDYPILIKTDQSFEIGKNLISYFNVDELNIAHHMCFHDVTDVIFEQNFEKDEDGEFIIEEKSFYNFCDSVENEHRKFTFINKGERLISPIDSEIFFSEDPILKCKFHGLPTR